MAKVNLVSQAEYAKHRGVSAVAVHKAVKGGRISISTDGKIDPVVADIQWEANTRARQKPGGSTKPAETSAPPAEAVPGEPDLVSQAERPTGEAGAPGAGAAPAEGAASGYTAARARREVAEAGQAELALAKQRGELVARLDVDRAGFEVGRDLRDAMEAAVNGLAAEVAAAGNADKCADLLRRHNRAVCDVLVKGWRERMGGVLQLHEGVA